MIQNIDSLLEQYLYNELGKPDAAELDFSFEIPTKQWSGKIKQDMISIYLLDVKENTQLRKNEWERTYTPEGKVDRQKPPVSLDLYYLITAYVKDEEAEKEHELFSSVLVQLYNYASLPKNYLDADEVLSALSGEIALELFPQKYIDEHLGFQLWSAIDQNARPFIVLKITAPLELGIGSSGALVKTKDISYVPLDKPLYTITGRILYEKAGAQIPVASATIELKDQEEKTLQTHTTDPAGRFSIGHLIAQECSVAVTAEGFKSKSVPLEEIPKLSAGELTIIVEEDPL